MLVLVPRWLASAGITFLLPLCAVTGARAQGTWSAVAPMAAPRDAHAALPIATGPLAGTVLFLGGRTAAQGATTVSAEVYDPIGTRFTAAEPMPSSRAFSPVVSLDSGRLLVCGGYQQVGERGGTIR